MHSFRLLAGAWALSLALHMCGEAQCRGALTFGRKWSCIVIYIVIFIVLSVVFQRRSSASYSERMSYIYFSKHIRIDSVINDPQASLCEPARHDGPGLSRGMRCQRLSMAQRHTQYKSPEAKPNNGRNRVQWRRHGREWMGGTPHSTYVQTPPEITGSPLKSFFYILG